MHQSLVLILAVLSFAVVESCEAAPKKLPTAATSESKDEEPAAGGRGGQGGPGGGRGGGGSAVGARGFAADDSGAPPGAPFGYSARHPAVHLLQR